MKVTKKQRRAYQQHVYDIVGPALLKQGRRAINPDDPDDPNDDPSGQCALRGSRGTRCALGWLISDKNYNARDDERHIVVIGSRLATMYGVPCDFLWDLQRIHDHHAVSQWRTQLLHLAYVWDLDDSSVRSFK